MKTQTILFVNLCVIVSMCLLLFNLVEAEDNTTQKLVTRCRENERRALMEFKADLVDDFGILSSWGNNSNEKEECCNWKGIRCSNLTGHVTALNIPGYFSDDPDPAHAWVGLTGKVSPSLSELKHLKCLNLSSNEFYGEIPPQLGNLTNLRSLDLMMNRNLQLENLDWLSHLNLLTHLDLSFLSLGLCTGWLNQVFKLSFLTHLHLRGCSLPEYDPSLLVNSSFSALNSLAMIDLSNNHFISSRTYNWLFNITTTTLSYVDLSYNSFLRSEFPEAFGRMNSLESLFLSSCNFEGMIPDSFMNFSRLATLDMAGNNFNGSLSKFLHPLATKENNSIQVLKLDRNQLDDSLRDFFPSFSSLREMSISYNKLSGSFPDSFVQLSSSLVHLDLSYNQITGQLPNLTLFSSLETLALANNKLEGTVPEAYFSNLSKLNHLDLSFNSLSLKFSFDWVPAFQLDRILLHNCTLGPQFPNWIKSQHSFSVLDISNVGISDTIPLWFWDHLPPIVRYLSLSNNDIRGILPDLSLKFNGAYSVRLDVRSNRLNGPIPPIPTNLVTLDLSQNMFSGSLSFLCTTLYKFLERIDLSDNQISGELPDCFMNVPYLSILLLAKNNLSGMIPTSITLLNQLQALQLRNNGFNGELPSSLSNCTELALLDLSENEFSGEVPKWIGNDLSILVVFSLRKNEFSGIIPEEICNLTHAHVLDFSQNKFSGNIPNCINNIDSLIEKDTYQTDSDEELLNGAYNELSQYTTYYLNAVVQWKGVASEYRNTLGLLKLIDLSSNRLVGRIPKEFSSLKELIALNLSGNNLTGNIIQEIGEMKLLEVLDLSRNQLSGEIPRSLASLTLLSVLDLSMNNLTGRIPTSTQLQSFDASKYAGNEQLCGLPLPNKCGYVVSSPVGDDKEDDDRLSNIGLYATAILGFVSGFWGFVGPIMLRRFRSSGFNRLLDKIADHIYVTTTLYMARLQRKIYG